MKIQINSSGFARNITIPNAIAFNPVTALAVPFIMKRNGVNLTVKASYRMINAIKYYRKANPEWCLIEVNSSQGDIVKIKL